MPTTWEVGIDETTKKKMAAGRARYWKKYHETYEETAGERWFAKVLKQEDGCWLWNGAERPGTGYGSFHYRDRDRYAHRWGYEYFVEEIPEGMELDHLCRQKMCVNPEHLEVVTHRENVLRGENFSAKHARKTHCIHGHEFSGYNLIIVRKKGKHPARRCRTCKNEAEKLRKRRLRAS